MLSPERLKPLAALGLLGAAALTWVFAFRSGWSNADWNQQWSAPAETRGRTIYIGSKDVETTLEKEKRLAVQAKDLREQVREMRKSVLGDRRKTRGDDVRGEGPEVPEGFDYNPRDACLQMQLEYPERFGKVDCMSDRYDSPDPWWKASPMGQ